MDKEQLRQYIESYFSDKGAAYNAEAIDRLLNPSYLKEERLPELSDDAVKKATQPLLDECIERYKKRAKRSKAGRDGYTRIREIDTRTVVRRYFGKAEPYAKPPEPEAPAEESAEGEGEAAEAAES